MFPWKGQSSTVYHHLNWFGRIWVVNFVYRVSMSEVPQFVTKHDLSDFTSFGLKHLRKIVDRDLWKMCVSISKCFLYICVNVDHLLHIPRSFSTQRWKADCGLCSGAVLKDHKAVQCNNCKMWVHNGCSFITESQYETSGKYKLRLNLPKMCLFQLFRFFFWWAVKLWKSKWI